MSDYNPDTSDLSFFPVSDWNINKELINGEFINEQVTNEELMGSILYDTWTQCPQEGNESQMAPANIQQYR